MRTRIGLYIIALMGLHLSACNNGKKVDEQRYTWSSDAPLTIPYRTRIQRFGKMNLLRNPSFETGRTFAIDSTTTSFVIEGWQQTGHHIEWVDTRIDSLYTINEAYSGNRAVKITREIAYETDEQGEGVLSDFIKVIPGNYHLSLYVRAQDVFPARARLGMKMYDGIDVRLLYYDRNKIPLKPGYLFPERNQVIDASFKALSFANFSSIPAFGWGRIIGKSHHFPFPEGDIPSNAHYVKIFVGLKGTGVLWVDSIDFHYSSRNFSVAESMQPFTDTTFSLSEAIIPVPKRYVRMGSLQFFKPGLRAEQLPIIVIPASLDAVGMNAVKRLRDALEDGIKKASGNSPKEIVIPIVKSCSQQQLSDSKLVFSIGRTALYNDFVDLLPEHDIEKHGQGYYLYTPNEYPNLVLLGANNSTGLYYAVLTALQMIDGQTPVFHNARIVDFPDFACRFYSFDPATSGSLAFQSTAAGELLQYKLNGIFLPESDANSALFEAELKKTLDVAGNGGLFGIVALNRFETPDDSTLTYAYPLEEELERGHTSGALNLPVSISMPGTCNAIKLRVPSLFHNEMLDNSSVSYFPRQADVVVKNIYSGSSFYSLLTDDADIDRYSSIMGSRPVFMDNSMLIYTSAGHFGGSDPYYPGKIRLFNIFEPFQHVEVKTLFPKLDPDIFLINLPANSEIEIIRLATAADFLWNAGVYRPHSSLWRVLVSRYGTENARQLIFYAEKYSLMLELILRLEKEIQVARNFKTGQQTMADLTSLVAKLNETLGASNNLVKELLDINAALRDNLNQHGPQVTVKK